MNNSTSTLTAIRRALLAFCFAVVLGGGMASSDMAGAAGDKAGAGKKAPAILYMIDEDGCPYCERWREEVGIAYPKTSEGKFAPLTTYDIADKETAELGRVVFTPTFIIVANGKEIGRILGYPGVDFFWPMLDDILVKVGYKPDADEATPVQ